MPSWPRVAFKLHLLMYLRVSGRDCAILRGLLEPHYKQSRLILFPMRIDHDFQFQVLLFFLWLNWWCFYSHVEFSMVLFPGTLVLLALAFLTPLFYYIPTAALAAVIIMAVTDMIDFSMIKHLWIINSEFVLITWILYLFAVISGEAGIWCYPVTPRSSIAILS